MGHHLTNYNLSSDWFDITTLSAYQEIINTLITIQASAPGTECYVFLNSGGTPGDNDGSYLNPTVGITQISSNWWLKGHGRVSILVE